MASLKNESWKNPKDIMRAHRIQRSSRRLSRSQSLNLSRRASFPLSKENMSSQPSGDADSLKRHNPFSCDSEQPTSKQRLEMTCSQSIGSATLEDYKKLVSADFFQEDQESKEKEDTQVQEVVESMGRSLKSMQDKLSMQKLKEVKNATNLLNTKTPCDSSLLASSETSNISKVVYAKPVLDWCLKTKMRVVTSRAKLTGSEKLPGIDAKHLNSFVHGSFETDEWHNLDVFHQIRRCSFHYSYPKMPWMSTFPRLKSYFKSKSSFLETSDPTVLDSLQKDWSRVFTSVYQQLRSGLCPYFYVCTHQFTVLFRCLRSSSKCYLTALLSPSTRGLRELLGKEGITFRMPNIRKEKNTTAKSNKKCLDNDGKDSSREQNNCGVESKKSDIIETGYHSNDDDLFDDGDDDDNGKTEPEPNPSNGANENDDDDAIDATPGDDEEDNDNQAFDWLEDMGLDKKDFPTLRPHNVKLNQRENYQEIDNRPQSLVYIEGLDVHAFFNFLLNYPACIASSGPQYGIPPTLISPHPFEGGTLVSNSVKQSIIRSSHAHQPSESGDGSCRPSHVIEINGPILPHHTLNISAILKASKSTSTISYSAHPPSTAFNTAENVEPRFDIMTTGLSKLLVPFSSNDLGLLKDVAGELLSDSNMSTREAGVSNLGFTYH